jgi:phage portal protein BeeE
LAPRHESFAGSHRAAKAIILDSGTKWEQISISPEDAEFLESRKFTTEELARIFNVPPPMIGDLNHGTFTNTETMVRLFATNTLTLGCGSLRANSPEAFSALQAETLTSSSLIYRACFAVIRRRDGRAGRLLSSMESFPPIEVREEEGWNPGAPPKFAPASAT